MDIESIATMRTFLRVLSLLGLFLVMSVAAPVFAGSEPLPSLPPQWLTDKVINETRGPTFTEIWAPEGMWNRLAAFGGVFDLLEWHADWAYSVSYISTTAYLYESVVPFRWPEWSWLEPDITAPGSPSAPGQIIGVTYQRGRGVMPIVATFPSWSSTTPTGLRFYYTNTQYYSATPVVGQFSDPDWDQRLNAADAGAVISDKYSCLAIGLRQVCWAPYSTSQLRDADAVRNLLSVAYNAAQLRYNITVTFGLSDAVPDLIGVSHRTACDRALETESLTQQFPGCWPNLAFVHANQAIAGQPIGLWVVREAAQLKAYNLSGAYLGWVQPNTYLVMDATPTRTTPGQVGVLMLVAVVGNQHVLIPSNVMQGFGQSDVINEWEAAIKDGTLRFRGF